MTTTHGNPTDIPDPNGSTHARLNWWKDRNDELHDENEKLRNAIEYCLTTLKSHHMTKPGISTLVRKAEDILKNTEDENGGNSLEL